MQQQDAILLWQENSLYSYHSRKCVQISITSIIQIVQKIENNFIFWNVT